MTTPKHPYTNPLPFTLTTWRKCVIWCAMSGGGVREVVAQVYGVWAFHHTVVEDEGYAYDSLTHIPTGKVLCHSTGDVDLRELAERLTALGDWNTRSVGRLKRLREAM